MATAQEVDGGIIEYADYPLLELIKFLAAPTVVVAHQLGCVGKLMAIDACGEGNVGVAAKSLALAGPLHKYAHGCIGIRPCAANLPAQGVLEGHRSTTGTVHVVLAR